MDCPEEDRPNAEPVAGPDFTGMRGEKIAPARRWRSSMDASHGRLNDDTISLNLGVIWETSAEATLNCMRRENRDFAYLVNEHNRRVGVITADHVAQAIGEGRDESSGYVQTMPTARAEAIGEEILLHRVNNSWPVVVIEEDSELPGVVERNEATKASVAPWC